MFRKNIPISAHNTCVAVGLVITCENDIEELNVVGNWILVIGGIIVTICAQKELSKNKQEDIDTITKEELMEQIRKLEIKCNKIQ